MQTENSRQDIPVQRARLARQALDKIEPAVLDFLVPIPDQHDPLTLHRPFFGSFAHKRSAVERYHRPTVFPQDWAFVKTAVLGSRPSTGVVLVYDAVLKSTPFAAFAAAV